MKLNFDNLGKSLRHVEDRHEFEVCKLIVVGNVSVGKTSIVHRLCDGKFTTNYKSTIGTDFFTKKVDYNSKTYQLQVWDIGGQERFHSMTHLFYKGAVSALVVFDISNTKSLIDTIAWKNDIVQKVTFDGQTIPIFLVANKSDLTSAVIKDSEIEQFCKTHQFTNWTKTSAKNNTGIDKLFNNVVDVIDSTNSGWNINIDGEIFDSFHLDEAVFNTKKRRACCF